MTDRPQFVPGFQGARSIVYRSEYAIVTVAILAFLVWRYLYAAGSINVLEIIFWAVFPDLAFVPIGIASRKRAWPKWGAFLYNFFHTVIVWTAVFVVTWVVFKTELLEWLCHISTDRAVGYGLRETKRAQPII